MDISEYDEEQWYGDPNKVAKMIANNYKKEFFNNLKALQLDNCTLRLLYSHSWETAYSTH